MNDLHFDALENFDDERQRRLPPRRSRPRETVIHFVQSVLESLSSYNTEEALKRYSQAMIARNILLKKIKRTEEELNQFDRELAELEPIVLASLLNPSQNCMD